MKVSLVQYNKHILITVLSCFFSLGLFVVSQIELDILRLALTITFVFTYCIFLLSRDYRSLLLNSIISIYFIYFIFTMTNRKLIGISAIDYLYVIDIILLVIFLRVLVDKTIFPLLNKEYHHFLQQYSLLSPHSLQKMKILFDH